MGDHGYDNSLPSMHPFFAGVGPGFRQGYQISSLQSVDVYPLMCRLLAVPCQPNNGTLTQARCLLVNETCLDLLLVISLVVGVLMLLTALTGRCDSLVLITILLFKDMERLCSSLKIRPCMINSGMFEYEEECAGSRCSDIKLSWNAALLFQPVNVLF